MNDQPVQTLISAEDKYGGLVIDVESLPTNTSVFVDSLNHSLAQWRTQVTKHLLLNQAERIVCISDLQISGNAEGHKENQNFYESSCSRWV